MPAPASPSPTAAAPSEGAAPSAWSRLRAAPWVVSTYFAEGLPFSILRQLLGELFTSLGVRIQDIGLTGAYGLAWNLKLLWSPFVDRYGTIRRWLWVVEALLGLVVMALAIPAGRGDVGGVARIAIVAAFLAATHDIAIDGFYLEALDKPAQAQLSGLRIAAYRIALLAGKGLLAGAGLLQLAGWSSQAAWRATFIVAGAGLLLLAAGHAMALPRPPRERAEGAPKPRYHEAFLSLLRQPKIAWSLAFIVAYKAGDALLFAMNAPFLKSLGFGDFLRGTLGSAAVVASVGGSIAGGIAISRYTLRRALTPIAIAQSLAILAYVAMAVWRPGMVGVSVIAVFEQLAGGVGDAALAMFLMRRCSPDHKAAHFAIVSALMSVATTVAGMGSGYLLAAVGYPVFFAIAFAVSIPGVALTWFVPKD